MRQSGKTADELIGHLLTCVLRKMCHVLNNFVFSTMVLKSETQINLCLNNLEKSNTC